MQVRFVELYSVATTKPPLISNRKSKFPPPVILLAHNEDPAGIAVGRFVWPGVVWPGLVWVGVVWPGAVSLITIFVASVAGARLLT